MKRALQGAFLLLLTAVIASPSAAQGTTRVRGYVKSSTGEYVAPHYRTTPNTSRFDNWSTKGNVNPYTGQAGTRSPYSSYTPPTYSKPRSTYAAPSYSNPYTNDTPRTTAPRSSYSPYSTSSSPYGTTSKRGGR